MDATGPDSPVQVVVDCGLVAGKLINKWYIYNWWHNCNKPAQEVRWINMQHNLRVRPPTPSASASPRPSPSPSNPSPGIQEPNPTPTPKVDPCDEPEEPDEGEAEIDGKNEKILIFDASALEDSAAKPQNVTITHRIVTINSPEARDLKGVMKINKIQGDESAYKILHNGAPLTFPAEIPIEEPGHEGCGRHDGHSGIESLSITPLKNSALVLEISVDPDDGAALPDKSAKLMLVPVDMAVDANRDGVIKFAGNFNSSDPNLAGKPQDKTEESKPFRFWINDDNDGLPNAEGEAVGTGTSDYEDGVIQTARDLEDFARLYVHIGGFYEEIADGTFKIGLKWRDTNGTAPKVKVYKSTDTAGSDSYLKEDTAAFAQVSGDDVEMLGEVTGSGELILDREGLFSGYSKANPKLCLLFEGSGEGKGQLCITIHKADGAPLGEGPGVWLDLKNVKKMYVRSYGKPRSGSVIWQKPNEYNPYQEPVVTNADMDAVPFEKPTDETLDTIVLVHGIHGAGIFTESQALDTYTQMASTTFKRLWHQGFKGRFGFYKWEAHHISQFNESEYRAWKSGRGLAAFLTSLPGKNKNLICFSQGGVVGSSAIRDYGATPNAMIVMQAAIPAVCYDSEPTLNRFPNALPDTVADLGYRGYHGTTGTRIINFSDPTDDATGDLWGVSQNLKPEPRYGYDPAAPLGQRHTATYRLAVGRFVMDLHESLPMITRSKSRTIAHEPGAAGVISSSVPLDSTFGFNNEHGAAFDRPIQNNLNDFYDEVLSQFGIPFNL
ncbi:MAG: hypothetical protein ACOYM3_19470 [Terrimicrobiaceae bacterium]